MTAAALAAVVLTVGVWVWLGWFVGLLLTLKAVAAVVLLGGDGDADEEPSAI
ncbi:hypothetical protein Daura_30210 [Dactylosporangium aurantiacum]|uniref:Uncharacterized protein n=1 Tax=Dactylosporangium aurantiacum TaxID=35754 RepID=A0A9Q9M9S9_9ACTN|nr:hypothetical protein [Dactylosporangium aurantiacum]MDG6110478.1 hypothetical protein [Dactylosporangium aurantiacum]UWZ51038.1 hypothetical protein Daura_30210 [Dactylosporangium aurantiacum]